MFIGYFNFFLAFFPQNAFIHKKGKSKEIKSLRELEREQNKA